MKVDIDALKRLYDDARLSIECTMQFENAIFEAFPAIIAELEENERAYERIVGEKTYQQVADEIAELEAQLAASNQRVELLEYDMKSGHYESLYAQTVEQLAKLTVLVDELRHQIAKDHRNGKTWFCSEDDVYNEIQDYIDEAQPGVGDEFDLAECAQVRVAKCRCIEEGGSITWEYIDAATQEQTK